MNTILMAATMIVTIVIDRKNDEEDNQKGT